MGTRDRRVDAYIARSPEFARPILEHFREAVHEACPEAEETLKWKMPTFMYKGMLCGMAAFKQHAALGFWKSKLVLTKDGKRADESWGQFGRITKLSEMPSKKALIGYVKKAAALNEQGITVPRRTKPKPPLPVPAYLTAALKKNKKASATFAAFSPSHRRDYIEWITEAKTEATRDRRLATAIEWMAEGKGRNWKYERRA